MGQESVLSTKYFLNLCLFIESTFPLKETQSAIKRIIFIFTFSFIYKSRLLLRLTNFVKNRLDQEPI